tara:strand:- start:595 stop:897 length:303 start_codon:yes stop_codon:yes gene_type:complete
VTVSGMLISVMGKKSRKGKKRNVSNAQARIEFERMVRGKCQTLISRLPHAGCKSGAGSVQCLNELQKDYHKQILDKDTPAKKLVEYSESLKRVDKNEKTD